MVAVVRAAFVEVMSICSYESNYRCGDSGSSAVWYTVIYSGMDEGADGCGLFEGRFHGVWWFGVKIYACSSTLGDVLILAIYSLQQGQKISNRKTPLDAALTKKKGAKGLKRGQIQVQICL